MQETKGIFQRSMLHRYLIPVAIGVILWHLPGPQGLDPQAWRMLAVFVATMAGIIMAPLPMSAVAIVGATIGTLLGVVDFSEVVSSNGTDLVWLILLAFFISRGVINSGLGRRIALVFLRALGSRTIGLAYGLALTDLVVAPAMPSVTARAGGVVLPITRAMADVMGSRPDPETRKRVGAYLTLCAFHANVITAGMFVTAMAGNPVAVQLAAGQGVAISWLDWAIGASVPGLLCLLILPIAMLHLVRPEITETPDAAALARTQLDAMGPLSRDEIVMAIIFVGLILLWVFGGLIGIGASQAAALGLVVMLIFGILTWDDALKEKAAWDTMIWIGLLIMLAAKLNEYGMVAWFGATFGVYLEGFPTLTVFVLVTLIYFYVRYFFASATAHISALFPVSLALLIDAGFPPFSAAIALGALSSVMGCLTQYAIGSGPVMFGTGYVTQVEWWKSGFVMSLIYLAIWLVIGPIWWSVIGLGG